MVVVVLEGHSHVDTLDAPVSAPHSWKSFLFCVVLLCKFTFCFSLSQKETEAAGPALLDFARLGLECVCVSRNNAIQASCCINLNSPDFQHGHTLSTTLIVNLTPVCDYVDNYVAPFRSFRTLKSEVKHAFWQSAVFLFAVINELEIPSQIWIRRLFIIGLFGSLAAMWLYKRLNWVEYKCMFSKAQNHGSNKYTPQWEPE